MAIEIKNYEDVIKTIITIIVSIVFTVVSYSVVYIIRDGELKSNVINNLYTVGKEQKNSIVTISNEMLYEIKLYSNMESLKSMNKEKVARDIAFIKANRERYVNILVIDDKKNLVYGYIDDFSKFSQDEYINKALATNTIKIKTVNINDRYYVDVYSPIKNDADITVGLAFFRVSTVELNNIIKNIRINEGVESYILDKDGVFITESRFIPDALGKQKVNLKRVKLNIDHSSSVPYKDYRGKEVYGRYFPLNIDEWTLIIEIDTDYDKAIQQKTKLIAEVNIGLQAIIIILIKNFLNKRFGLNIEIEEFKKDNSE